MNGLNYGEPMISTPDPNLALAAQNIRWHNLYTDLRGTGKGVISSAIEAIQIQHGAKKLITATKDPVQTLEAILVYRSYREAKSSPNLIDSLESFHQGLHQKLAKYSFFPNGFTQSLIDSQIKKLCLLYARKAPLSEKNLKEYSLYLRGVQSTIDIRELYSHDLICRQNAFKEVASRLQEIHTIEKEKIAPLYQKRMSRITTLETKIAKLEKEYEKTPDEAKKQTLLKILDEYDNLTDYIGYLNAFLSQLGNDFDQLNQAKDVINEIKQTMRGAEFEALPTPPKFSKDHLPEYGSVKQILSRLMDAIEHNCPVLAMRLYERLSQYKPLTGNFPNAKLAFNHHISDDNWKGFLRYPTEESKQAIISILKTAN